MEPNQEIKSVSAEDTFPEDLTAVEEMNKELEKIGEIVNRRLTEHKLQGRTITLKIKYHDFKIITRSKSFPEPCNDVYTIVSTAKELLLSTEFENARVRLLGIALSNFGEKTSKTPIEQLPLFE